MDAQHVSGSRNGERPLKDLPLDQLVSAFRSASASGADAGDVPAAEKDRTKLLEELQLRLKAAQNRSDALERRSVLSVDSSEVKGLEEQIAYMSQTLRSDGGASKGGIGKLSAPKTGQHRGRIDGLAASFSVFPDIIRELLVAQLSQNGKPATVADLQQIFGDEPSMVAYTGRRYRSQGKDGEVCASGAVGQFQAINGEMRSACISIKLFRSDYIRFRDDTDCWRDFLLRISVSDLWTGDALFEAKQSSSDDFDYNSDTDSGLLHHAGHGYQGSYFFTPGGLGVLMSAKGNVPRPSTARGAAWTPEFLGRMRTSHFVKGFDEYLRERDEGSYSFHDMATLIASGDLALLVDAWSRCDFSTARAAPLNLGILELLEPSVSASTSGFSGRSTR